MQGLSRTKVILNIFKFSSDLQGLMLVFQGIPGSHAMQKRSGSQQAVTSCCSVQTQFSISAKPSLSHAHTAIVRSPNTPLHPFQNPMAAWPQKNESYTEHLQVQFRSPRFEVHHGLARWPLGTSLHMQISYGPHKVCIPSRIASKKCVSGQCQQQPVTRHVQQQVRLTFLLSEGHIVRLSAND